MSRKEVACSDAKVREERVLQGLQKKKKCSLCMQYFFVSELPGAITFKSILNLRMEWGHDISAGGRMPSPSQLYKREELCIFCMQFFDVDGLNATAGGGGVGASLIASTIAGSPMAQQGGGITCQSGSSSSNH